MAHLPPSRRLRRRERARRRRFLAGAVFAGLLITASLLWLSMPRVGVTTEQVAVTGDGAADLLAVSSEPVVGDLDQPVERPTYPYSIIPGGAHSIKALRQAIDDDPVVRAHYANFDLSRTRVVRLTEPRVAHVSYRIGDQVFWTSRRLLLKAGETVLTDGVHYARTRCGNQLAVLPGTTSAEEPTPDVFDTPLPRRLGARAFPPIILPTPGSLPPPGAAPGGAFTPGPAGGSFPVGGALKPVGSPIPPQGLNSQTPGADDAPFAPVGLKAPQLLPGDDAPRGGPKVFNEDPPGGSPSGDPRAVPEPEIMAMMLAGGGWWYRRWQVAR